MQSLKSRNHQPLTQSRYLQRCALPLSASLNHKENAVGIGECAGSCKEAMEAGVENSLHDNAAAAFPRFVVCLLVVFLHARHILSGCCWVFNDICIDCGREMDGWRGDSNRWRSSIATARARTRTLSSNVCNCSSHDRPRLFLLRRCRRHDVLLVLWHVGFWLLYYTSRAWILIHLLTCLLW